MEKLFEILVLAYVALSVSFLFSEFAEMPFFLSRISPYSKGKEKE